MKINLIVALDLPSYKNIQGILDELPSEIIYYKVGLELFTNSGPKAIEYLKQQNKKIFLDLKLHDIPRTVARTITRAAEHGVDLLTLHASGGKDMLKAATEAAKESGTSAPKLIAVTTLTSLDECDLREMGISQNINDHTIALGEMAINAGIDGLVCSPKEALIFREHIGNKPIMVTPGIRPKGTALNDQKRVATPEEAIKAGSNFLVVGRPILNAKDPYSVAKEIITQIMNLNSNST